MQALTFATLTVTGFVACAEFGSYAFVHPVLRHLPATERIHVEQGLLKTFGRVMPLGMTLSLVLSIAFALDRDNTLWAWAAVAAFAAALVSTLVFNVPVNLATGRWDANNPPRRMGTGPHPMGTVPGRPILAPPRRLRSRVPRNHRVSRRTVRPPPVIGRGRWVPVPARDNARCIRYRQLVSSDGASAIAGSPAFPGTPIGRYGALSEGRESRLLAIASAPDRILSVSSRGL